VVATRYSLTDKTKPPIKALPASPQEYKLSQDLEILRKRALYRATHRGTMEMDWLLGQFAQTYLKTTDLESLAYFERFLAEPDPALQNMILGKEDACVSEFAGLISEIRAFHGLTGKDDKIELR